MLLLLIIGLSVVTAVHHHHHHEPYTYNGRNQRIIKLHSSPYKHHPHHKHIRPGPLGPHIHYHDSHDHHYEYIRPSSYPPIPPFVNSGPSPKFHSRPPYHHYKSPSPYVSGPIYKPSTFRSPIIKDHFRSPSLPSPPVKPSVPFEYLPASKPSLNHIINSDDDRGPIHEIPAPNLGPKPDHIDDTSLLINSPKEPLFTSIIKETPVINFEKKPSYEVVESNDKVIQHSDGTKTLFAPDPDPSIPAPKIPATNDPHSSPSKPGHENFPTGQEYQILEATPSIHEPIPNLSGQELFDLMHSFPNDEYTVYQTSNVPSSVPNVPAIPSVQDVPQHVLAVLGSQIPYQGLSPVAHQPNYIQHSSHSHSEVENNGIVHETAINHQESNHQYHDFNHPQFHSFNYDERNHNAGAVPVEHYNNHFMYEPEASESESQGSVIKQNGDTKTKTKQSLPSDVTNLIPDDEDDQDQSPIFKLETNSEIPFYSSLPNKAAAEALATLQAAGSIASKIKKLRGDQDPEVDGEEQFVNFGLPSAELTKPHQVHNHAPAVLEEAESKTEEKTVEIQKSVPIYEASYKATSLDEEIAPNEDEILANLDAGQGASSEKFGRRIRPK